VRHMASTGQTLGPGDSGSRSVKDSTDHTLVQEIVGDVASTGKSLGRKIGSHVAYPRETITAGIVCHMASTGKSSGQQIVVKVSKGQNLWQDIVCHVASTGKPFGQEIVGHIESMGQSSGQEIVVTWPPQIRLLGREIVGHVGSDFRAGDSESQGFQRSHFWGRR
jgi:hypothetical protein